MHSVVIMSFKDEEYSLTPRWAMLEPDHVLSESLKVYEVSKVPSTVYRCTCLGNSTLHKAEYSPCPDKPQSEDNRGISDESGLVGKAT